MINRLFTRWYLFPFLFGVYVVNSFYTNYIFDTQVQEVAILSVFVVLFLYLVWYIFNFLFKNVSKSSLITFVFATLFFSFQNTVSYLRLIAIRGENIDLARYWLSRNGQILVFTITLILFVFILMAIKNLKKIPNSTLVFLNIATILLLIFSIFRLIQKIEQDKEVRKEFVRSWDTFLESSTQFANSNNELTPNVYYIILDGFARSDILLELYHYDNSNLIQALKERGFYIGEDSYSNYSQTRTSLPSSMNFMYLLNLEKFRDQQDISNFPLYYMLENSIVENQFSAFGYRMISFISDYSFSNFSDWDEHYENKFIPPRFTQTFFNSTAASVFVNPYLYKWHRYNVNFIFDGLSKTPMLKGPFFVFAHISCPHPPFVFEADGKLKKEGRLFLSNDQDGFQLIGTSEEYLLGYRDQVKYLEKKTLSMIDEILNNSSEPLILILQADHGPGMQSYFMGVENVNLEERMSILNAYYFFDQDYRSLYPSISPVNTFRVIFSQYLGIELPLLEDYQYYSTFLTPYDLIPVSEKIQKGSTAE